MSEDVVIERRFRGPPDSANGGYTCGLVASQLGRSAAAEVTLLSPPPLERALAFTQVDGGVELRDGEQLIASGRPSPPPELVLPDPVTLEEAQLARRESPLHREHPFPSCFVCGPQRERGDGGLRMICGHVPGRDVVAAPLETAEWMGGDAGEVREELVWSALDCPGGLARMLTPELGVTVLGRLTAELRGPLRAGEDFVAIGWQIEREGRKAHAGSAIFDRSGEPLALARATWIELREQPPA